MPSASELEGSGSVSFFLERDLCTRCPDRQRGRGPNGEQRMTFVPPWDLADFCNRHRPQGEVGAPTTFPLPTHPPSIWPGASSVPCGWISNGPKAAISESGESRLQTDRQRGHLFCFLPTCFVRCKAAKCFFMHQIEASNGGGGIRGGLTSNLEALPVELDWGAWFTCFCGWHCLWKYLFSLLDCVLVDFDWKISRL